MVSLLQLHSAVLGKEKHLTLQHGQYVLRACQFILAQQLRSMCYANGREKDGKSCAEVIRRLALVYRFRSPDKLRLIKSAALLNAAAQRQPDNLEKICDNLKELCSHVLTLAGGKRENIVDKTDYFYNMVEKLRENVKEELDKEMKEAKSEEGNKRQAEKQKIERVMKVQTYVTGEYSDIMGKIMKYCIQIKGEPLCKYALVGMGSLARNEITPYSDFESIIVLEEGVQLREDYEEVLEYFRWVAVIFQLVLVNFGETIIPFLCIKGLNDPYKKEDNWFYDEHTCCGICPDGFAPHASKNPLGRQKTKQKSWLTELIKPVGEMLKYLETSEDLKNGYHLTDILLKTCFIEGNRKLYDDFASGVTNRRREMSQSIQFHKQLEEDLQAFEISSRITSIQLRDKFDLKRTVFRSVTLFVAALGRYYESNAVRSLDTIDDLESIIGSDFSHRLKVAVCTACETRLKMYTETGGQNDQVFWDAFRYDPAGSGLLNAASVDGLAHLFQVSEELQMLVEKTVLRINDEAESKTVESSRTEQVTRDKNYFKIVTCMILGLYQQTLEECQQYLVSSQCTAGQRDWCQAIMTHSLYRLGGHEECYDKCIEFMKTNSRKELLCMTGECLLQMGRYTEALVWFQNCLATISPDDNWDDMLKADCLFRSGECLFRLDLYSHALGKFEEAKTIYSTKGVPRTVVDCLDMEGKSLYNMGQMENALGTFLCLLESQKRLTEKETHDSEIAETLKLIYLCLIQLDRWEEADAHKWNELDIHENILEAYEDISSDNELTVHMVVSCRLDIANCLSDLGRNDDSTECRNEAVQDLEATLNIEGLSSVDKLAHVKLLRQCYEVLGEFEKTKETLKMESGLLQSQGTDEINIMNLAECYRCHGRFLEENNKKNEALVVYEDELAVLKTLLDKQPNICTTILQKMGQCYMSLSKYHDALDTFRQQFSSIETNYDTHGDYNIYSLLKDKELANCHRNIALATEKSTGYEEALQCYNLELGLRRGLGNSDETKLPIADCLVQIGFCYFEICRYDDATRCFQESIEISESAAMGTLTSTVRFLGQFGYAKCQSKFGNHDTSLQACISAVSTLMQCWQKRHEKSTVELWLKSMKSFTSNQTKLACFQSHRIALYGLNKAKHYRLIECFDLVEQTLAATTI